MPTYSIPFHEIVDSYAFQDAVEARRQELVMTFMNASPGEVDVLQEASRNLKALEALVDIFKARASQEKKR